MLRGSDSYKPEEANYGLEPPVFVLIESLLWFSQALRSGVWTYFEATPVLRQEAMLWALRRVAPKDFSEYYTVGMKVWKDENKIRAVDTWMQNNDEENNRLLWRLAIEHRASIERLCG